MNMQTAPAQTRVTAPPPPGSIEEMRLPVVMMRDILLKTMFRKNVTMVTDVAAAQQKIKEIKAAIEAIIAEVARTEAMAIASMRAPE